jgi:hypothetical protein
MQNKTFWLERLDGLKGDWLREVSLYSVFNGEDLYSDI